MKPLKTMASLQHSRRSGSGSRSSRERGRAGREAVRERGGPAQTSTAVTHSRGRRWGDIAIAARRVVHVRVCVPDTAWP